MTDVLTACLPPRRPTNTLQHDTATTPTQLDQIVAMNGTRDQKIDAILATDTTDEQKVAALKAVIRGHLVRPADDTDWWI